MAYVNVYDWRPDQVTDWLKGLDNVMYHYINSFTNNGVHGKALLNIRPYELEQLGMYSIGHQEIVLEAVEHLRNFHFNLDKENLQFLALHVATLAKCLYKELSSYSDKSKIETKILNDITSTISKIKALIAWLDRPPFAGLLQFNEIKKQMVRLGIEMATSAQRDRFVQNPVVQVRTTSETLAKLADYIIQDISDPMLLQPGYLNLVTLKKKESEIGFSIAPSYHGIHVIIHVNFNSPAHTSGKIEVGDEIVQINYQTVVGWQYKNVIQQLQESPPDVLLTLKKRPRHVKVYSRIYMQPYRLPSKKKPNYQWDDNTLIVPSPRVNLLNKSTKIDMETVLNEQKNNDSDSGGSDIILTPTTKVEPNKDLRLFMAKPRAILQRRNTICCEPIYGYYKNGSSNMHNSLASLWRNHERSKTIDDATQDSPSLRDKSVSFGFGLEIAPRPTTCLGISQTTTLKLNVNNSNNNNNDNNINSIIDNNNNNNNNSYKDMLAERNESFLKEKIGNTNKVVRFDANMKYEDLSDNKYEINIDNSILHLSEPILYVDEDDEDGDDDDDKTVTSSVGLVEQSGIDNSLNIVDNLLKIDEDVGSTVSTPTLTEDVNEVTNNTNDIFVMPKSCDAEGINQAVNEVVINKEIVRRGRLDKSFSTPAYNTDDDDSDVPPAIEPRKEYLQQTPPAPPPRPRKLSDYSVSNASSSSSQQNNIANIIVKPPMPQPTSTPCQQQQHTPSHQLLPSLSQSQLTKQPTFLSYIQSADNDMSSSTSIKSIVLPDINTTNQQIRKPIPVTKHFLDGDLELLTPNKTKNLTLKKKNSLMAKRRKISLKALDMSDIQGHLYRRSKNKQGVTYWAKLYFVLIDTTLYGFKSKDSEKADCLIFLIGFTVSLATEVHSKSNAFKVYHPTKTFYFAAESQQALAQWMEYITKATIKGSTNVDHHLHHHHHHHHHHDYQQQNIKELYSETECSDDDFFTDGNINQLQLATPSPISNTNSLRNKKMDGHSSVSDTISISSAPVNPVKHEKYHLGFGSLKKFTKQNLSFSSSSSLASANNTSSATSSVLASSKQNDKEKERNKNFSDIPVPTAQFRSYRKVPGNSGGLQLGTNSMISPTGEFMPTLLTSIDGTTSSTFTNHNNISKSFENQQTDVQPFTQTQQPQNQHQHSHKQLPQQSNNYNSSPISEHFTKYHQRGQQQTPHHHHSFQIKQQDIDKHLEPIHETFSRRELIPRQQRKIRKTSPYNYIHASNPNLVDFDFQTSKILDHSFPKINSSNSWDAHNNLQGLITLKDLMLQKQEEEAQDMYNNRVIIGVEKKSHKSTTSKQHRHHRSGGGNSVGGINDSNLNNNNHHFLSPNLTSSIPSPTATTTILTSSASTMLSNKNTQKHLNKIQSRSLPKTPDYAENFKPDDTEILMTRSKELLKLRDFGYEFISSDDTTSSGNQCTTTTTATTTANTGGTSGSSLTSSASDNHNLNNTMNSSLTKKKGLIWKYSSSSSDKNKGSSQNNTTEDDKSIMLSSNNTRTGSFKKNKSKLESFKTSSEKLFQFKYSNNDKESLQLNPKSVDKTVTPLKAVTSYAPLTLPLNKKSSNFFNISIDANANSNNHPEIENHRKNSAPERSASYFTKLTFTNNKTAKEKRLLGSPRLHRAIFGRRQSTDSHQNLQLDQDIFEPIDFNKPSPESNSYDISLPPQTRAPPPPPPPQQPPPPPPHSQQQQQQQQSVVQPDYPNLEYPPVFEPETYSLSDPQTSLTLLRRRNNTNNDNNNNNNNN